MKKVILPVVIAAMLLAALVLGVGNFAYQAGWSARDAKAKELAAESARQITRLIAEKTHLAQEKDVELEQAKDALEEEIASYQQQLSDIAARKRADKTKENQRGITQTTQPETEARTDDFFAAVLDPDAVRLHNQARRGGGGGKDGGSASTGYEEVSEVAPSRPVTGLEFARNDLEVVRLYRELAIAHDELVDWVSRECSAISQGE